MKKNQITIWTISEEEREKVNSPEYLNRIASTNMHYKFCKVPYVEHPYNPTLSFYENWAPNWTYDGEECFLTLFQTLPNAYRVLCLGGDDFGLEKSFSVDNMQEALNMFDMICDNTSVQELIDLGFKHF